MQMEICNCYIFNSKLGNKYAGYRRIYMKLMISHH
jgi:hypothetical protein